MNRLTDKQTDDDNDQKLQFPRSRYSSEFFIEIKSDNKNNNNEDL
mgnify:CR=1 FL=1